MLLFDKSNSKIFVAFFIGLISVILLFDKFNTSKFVRFAKHDISVILLLLKFKTSKSSDKYSKPVKSEINGDFSYIIYI